MNQFMKEAIKESYKSYKIGDVPIGAVIVENNKIIARAHNKKEKHHCATEHAEILAINTACKKKKNWRLEECTIYITMEPCLMCMGAILQSRIPKIVYGIKNENFGFFSQNNGKYEKSKIKVIDGICDDEIKQTIQKFFQEKRK